MGDLFNLEPKSAPAGPVECLGITFPNDDERRKHFLDKLREKLKDPEFRKIEGFPIGEDRDILVLSDPPYYTACPNPFLGDFIEHYGRPYDPDELYHREPFAIDVSEGKTDQLYRAHGYHTKVPHLAIVPSILHYTKPGDIVLDGFCGSGMTGVAAQWCGTAPGEYRRKLEQEWKEQERDKPEWGARRVMLGDLSPAATFIAANYNIPFDVDVFHRAASTLLEDVEEEVGWMYETLHTDGKTKGRINYTVWSEVFSCPECSGEVVFVEEALDPDTKRVRDSFGCPHCAIELTKRELEKREIQEFDPSLGETIAVSKRIPVLIEYVVGKTRYEKKPDASDLARLSEIEALGFPANFPNDRMMHAADDVKAWGDKWRAGTASFTHIHHLYLSRAAHALAALWRRAYGEISPRRRSMLLFFVEQAVVGMSLLNRYQPIQYGREGGSQVNRQLAGVYYVASQISECSPKYNLGGRLRRLRKAFTPSPSADGWAAISTGDCGDLTVADSSVDYVFTDPPFGDNLAYAELNFVVEAFHRCFTNMNSEAIVSSHQNKGLVEYQQLMTRCFVEYCRVLKPGRWMTVVFHNSRSSVWTAIQEAMQTAGFVIADVRVLDKKQGSFNQAVAVGSVKQDLVISAYKPNGGLEGRFELEAGTEEGVWDFIRMHLRQLPVFVAKDSQAEIIAERQNYLLFDRMVAFHVQRGVTVPISAGDFYVGLAQRFPERDGMYFLSDQVAEYDKKRMTVKEVMALSFFVMDEASAIQWLKQQLMKKPQTFQEVHPQFIKEIAGWNKHEKSLELSLMLEQNFLRYNGQDDVPSQIHSYLSSNFKELRNLAKSDPALRAKGKDRWYVPDPNKAGDLEKLRERSLLKEFDEYVDSSQKRLKVFRLEAVRAGFKRAWQSRDYATIIDVAHKISEKVLQEDPKLLMWYDQAITRSGTDE